MASQRSATQHAKEEVVFIPDNSGNSLLHQAVSCGDTSSVRMLLEGNASVNQKNHNGKSALHIFCEGSHSEKPDLELLNILITYKVDVNLQDKNGETPLHISLKKRKFEMAMALLENGALGKIPDSIGEWPLHKAVEYGKLSLVRKMLEGNVSVHQTTHDGQSALHICCSSSRSIEVLNTLITCKADINLQDKYGNTPLHISLKKRKFAMAMVLLENGALAKIPDSTGKWPLHKAVEYDELSLVRKMLEGNASVNQTTLDGQSALHICCNTSRSSELLDILMSRKGDVNLQDKNGKTPLHVSLEKRKFDMAMVLLENGALATIPDSTGECPLHKAVERGELSLVIKMLEGNVSVDQTNHDGQSALHICCDSFCSIEVLITLITCKADVNLQDKNGDTPLHISVKNHEFEMTMALLNILIRCEADVNLQDNNGNTPLHISLKYEHFKIAMVLLENGALTTIPDSTGEWPLHKAVEFGEQSLVREILEGSASANKGNLTVNKIDRYGKSALHILCGKKYRNSYNMPILMELIKYKADVNLQDKEGQTPMHISCVTKKWDLAMALLENGSLATILDNAGKCPLHEVVSNNPKAMFCMVNNCAIKPNENIELIIEACELAAMKIESPDSFECMHKATLLRIEHAIPKRTLEPMECYGFYKEWETIEELELHREDANQLKLQATLAKERIHQGQYEKLMPLIREDLISAILSVSKSEAGELLKHHLNICNSCKPYGDGDSSFKDLLKAWKNELEEHFESFDTMSIVKLILRAIENLANSVTVIRYNSASILSITKLITKLCRRNRQVENTSKNEEMLARELLQQLLDTDKGGERYPLQHLITEQSFRIIDVSYMLCDYELMKMLLESGIQVNAVNSDGDTILHAAVHSLVQDPYGCMQDCLFSQKAANQVIRTMELLLEKGVYPNAQNKEYETARDILGWRGCVTQHQHGENEDIHVSPMDVKRRINDILQQYELQSSMTLKHMAAVAVKKSGYSYENVLPDALVKFVDLHKLRRNMISGDSSSESDYDSDSHPDCVLL